MESKEYENFKQYRIRLNKNLINKHTEDINLTLLITSLLKEYDRNKNLRNKISKNINNNNIT